MLAKRLSAELIAAAPVFAALGDATRLRLVVRLSGGRPQSITQLSAGAAVTRQAITKHLHVLAESGLVRSRKQGREQMWELNLRQVQEAQRRLELIAQQWDGALARLKLMVEEDYWGRRFRLPVAG
jgi:DNA-binding transcriptional ArsR family regulator